MVALGTTKAVAIGFRQLRGETPSSTSYLYLSNGMSDRWFLTEYQPLHARTLQDPHNSTKPGDRGSAVPGQLLRWPPDRPSHISGENTIATAREWTGIVVRPGYSQFTVALYGMAWEAILSTPKAAYGSTDWDGHPGNG
ncbi:hypothetical protein BBP40_010946 [Aspergillus hancockii]|nr:hypothetical protein BBP40_010946 [Aspergillus hancockii]